MAWAKFPSRWIKGYAHGEKPVDEKTIAGGLREISWGENKSTGAYALLVLIALAVLSNEAQRAARSNRRPPGIVTASYDAIAALANISRNSISKGLSLLQKVGVIRVEREGTSNVYELVDTAVDGGWCMLPETYLLNSGNHLKRLTFAQEHARTKATLNAMKLYLLLLAFRDNSNGIASLSYEKIELYAGIRKEEIRAAISVLLVNGLCVIVTTEELAYEQKGQRHNRYRILGFRKGDAEEADRGLVQASLMAEEDARRKALEDDEDEDQDYWYDNAAYEE